jgi:hypothetical protein
MKFSFKIVIYYANLGYFPIIFIFSLFKTQYEK